MTKSHDHYKMAAGSAVIKEMRCLLPLFTLIYLISVVKTVSSISFEYSCGTGKQFQSCHQFLAVQLPVDFNVKFRRIIQEFSAKSIFANRKGSQNYYVQLYGLDIFNRQKPSVRSYRIFHLCKTT